MEAVHGCATRNETHLPVMKREAACGWRLCLAYWWGSLLEDAAQSADVLSVVSQQVGGVWVPGS